MLFTNTSLKSEVREMPFGQLEGISLGEKGRGRIEYFCPSPRNFSINKHSTAPASIGFTKSGKARINSNDDGKMYLILSARRGYTRGCYGHVEAPKGQAIQRLTHAYGAFGDAGRIGRWDEVIVQAEPGDWFRKSGCADKNEFYFVKDEKTVLYCLADDLADFCDMLDIAPPFSIEYIENEWQIVR